MWYPPFINSENKNVEGFVDSRNGHQVVDNYNQNLIAEPILMYFNQVHNSTTLSAPVVINDFIIPVVSATGIVVGSYIILFDPIGIRVSSFFVTAVNGLNITLDTEIDFAYPIGTNVDIAIVDLSVDGTASHQVFGIRGTGTPPGIDATLDITRLIIEMETDSTVSLHKFGNITELSKGVILRIRNGKYKNIFNVKTNGEIAVLSGQSWTPFLSTNPVQGIDGFISRVTFAGQDKIGVAIRLQLGEDLEIHVHDDLTAITKFVVMAQGHHRK